MRKAWEYLRIIHRETGWAIIDTQLGRVIDLDRDFEDVLTPAVCIASASRSLATTCSAL